MASLAIGAGASLLSGILGGKGAKKASAQQAAALQQAIDEQRRQFTITQANEQPFLDAGTNALTGPGGLLALLGMSGPEAQGSAITALKNSPAFTSQYATGLDAINQSAAATGGLRGGNAALAESNFGASLLNQVLGQQIGNVGGLVQLGSGTADTLGKFGAANSAGIGDLLAKIGGAKAAGTLGQTSALTGAIGDIGKMFGSGGIGGNLFGGGTGGFGATNFKGTGSAVTDPILAALLGGQAKF